jgi:hypothetical protein
MDKVCLRLACQRLQKLSAVSREFDIKMYIPVDTVHQYRHKSTILEELCLWLALLKYIPKTNATSFCFIADDLQLSLETDIA